MALQDDDDDERNHNSNNNSADINQISSENCEQQQDNGYGDSIQEPTEESIHLTMIEIQQNGGDNSSNRNSSSLNCQHNNNSDGTLLHQNLTPRHSSLLQYFANTAVATAAMPSQICCSLQSSLSPVWHSLQSSSSSNNQVTTPHCSNMSSHSRIMVAMASLSLQPPSRALVQMVDASTQTYPTDFLKRTWFLADALLAFCVVC